MKVFLSPAHLAMWFNYNNKDVKNEDKIAEKIFENIFLKCCSCLVASNDQLFISWLQQVVQGVAQIITNIPGFWKISQARILYMKNEEGGFFPEYSGKYHLICRNTFFAYRRYLLTPELKNKHHMRQFLGRAVARAPISRFVCLYVRCPMSVCHS